MPRFAGLQLRSAWGLSSDVEVASALMVRDAVANGASVVFTPTVSIVDPLYNPSNAYTRFKLLSVDSGGAFALTRPLSSQVEEIQALLNAVPTEARRVLSIAVGSLKEAEELIERVGKGVDAVELDVNLSCLLAGKDLTYIIELAKELNALLKTPLSLKINAASTSLVSLSKMVVDSGASALVLTPNLVYKLGQHFFRLHSPHVSTTLLLGVAEELTSLDVSLACVTQVEQNILSSIVPIRLYDVTYMLSWLSYTGPSRSSGIPLSWRSISRRLKVYAREGARFCPYGLIREEGFVSGCNYCGVCLELNPANVELAASIAPQ